MAAVLENPYARQAGIEYVWLKGNLHTHSTRSDGTRPMQEVVDAYAALGHDFLAMSDHDVRADYQDIDPRGMILVVGNEVTSHGVHMLQLGGARRIEPAEDRQQVIDQVNADGGLVVINHPNWQETWDHCPLELLLKLKGYLGIEIYNGDCIDDVGSGLAVEKWDRLLNSGRIVWGFANDDSHRPEHDGCGWNVALVRKDQLNAAGILAALRAGSFYASTGVVIDSIEAQGTELHIVAANAQEIEIYGDRGRRLLRVDGSEARFDVNQWPTAFVRAQLYGHGSQMAWTQPFVIRGGAGERRRILEEALNKPDAPRRVLKAGSGSTFSEAEWKAAPVSDQFYDVQSADDAAVRTAVRALLSPTQLALRVDCQEPLMDQVRNRITTAGNQMIWTEESVELFLDVQGTRQHYYHIMVNPAGAWYITDRAQWSVRLKSAVRAWKEKESWSLEVRLDLATLAPGLNVGTGSTMGLHINRNRKTVNRRYTWCWTGASNHRPERFGTLQL